MAKPVVVTACGDPGGAGALVPVIELLSAEGHVATLNFAYRQASQILQSRRISFRDIPVDADAAWFDAELRSARAALVLVATSFKTEEHEKAFIASAARVGVPSMAVLDFWANYGVRFADATGRLAYVPDRVTAMDAAAKEGLIADGIPGERIVVAGHPGFDDIARQRAAFTIDQRDTFRSLLGTPPHGVQVLFASQPLGELYGADASAPSYRGFDEQAILDGVIDAVEKFSGRQSRPVVLVIRPHPREAADAYEGRSSETVRIVVSKEGDARACAMASDLVVGMTTMLLVEAAYLGLPVVSLQPESRRPNMLPENLPGLTIVKRQADVANVLARKLDSIAAHAPHPRGPLPPLAAPAVARLTYDLIGLRR